MTWRQHLIPSSQNAYPENDLGASQVESSVILNLRHSSGSRRGNGAHEFTFRGVDSKRLEASPCPSCPSLSRPQEYTSPYFVTARVWCSPAATPTKLSSPILTRAWELQLAIVSGQRSSRREFKLSASRRHGGETVLHATHSCASSSVMTILFTARKALKLRTQY